LNAHKADQDAALNAHKADQDAALNAHKAAQDAALNAQKADQDAALNAHKAAQQTALSTHQAAQQTALSTHQAAQQAELALKAPLASPTFTGTVSFTGTVTAPTVVSSDNSALVSTTAFVQTQVNTLNNSISAETQSRNIAIQNVTNAINTNKEFLDLVSSRLAELYTFFNHTYDSVYSHNHPVYYNVTNIAQNSGFTLTQNDTPEIWPEPKFLTRVAFTASTSGSPYAHKLYFAPTTDLNNKTFVGKWDATGERPNFNLFPLEPATNYTVSIVLINKLTNQELTNLQAVQSITFSTPTINPTLSNFSVTNKTFGDSFDLTPPTSNSSGSFSYSSSDESVATISGSTVTIVGAGTVTITATQAATDNYGSSSIHATFSVGKATPELSNFSVTNKTFGDSFDLTPPTSNSSGSFSYSSSDESVATISGSTVTIVGAGPGPVTITATQAATDNYGSSSIHATFSVGKATPGLSNFSVMNKTFGDEQFTIDQPNTSSSGSFSYSSSDESVATISGSTVTIFGTGPVTITATQAATDNYESGSIHATLTINSS
jgi:hypothetical protein